MRVALTLWAALALTGCKFDDSRKHCDATQKCTAGHVCHRGLCVLRTIKPKPVGIDAGSDAAGSFEDAPDTRSATESPVEAESDAGATGSSPPAAAGAGADEIDDQNEGDENN